MTCECHTQGVQIVGSTTADTQTYILNAAERRTIDGRNENRRAALVVNQGAVDVVVSFGTNQPVDGGGPGYRLLPGEGLSVNTTDAVNVLNTSAASQATIGYVSEVG